MEFFLSTLKVTLVLWVLLQPTRPDKIKGRLPDASIISSFFDHFVRPFIDGIRENASPRVAEETKIGKANRILSSVFEHFIKPYIVGNRDSGTQRAADETKTEKAIRLKVASLKYMLQDDDEIDSSKVESDTNLRLDGNDETTIIEFVPKRSMHKSPAGKPEMRASDPAQNNILKYKELRKSIQTELDKEKTASSTKKLIVRTLDDMIAQLIERQCNWKPVDSFYLKDRLLKGPKDTRRSMKKLRKLSDSDWMGLKKQYLNFLKYNEGKEDDFMAQFHDFFSSVINDTWNLSRRYKVGCQLIKIDDNANVNNNKHFLRDGATKPKDICDSFKVCTDELKDFLTNFYSYLNDTTVSIFKNYAEMFVRDVNSETGVEKDEIVLFLNNISVIAEKKISKVYRKQVQNFTLDANKNKDENIQHINEFITATTEEVKRVLKKNLDKEFDSLETKLYQTIKEDLKVNLRVDMDNLSQLFGDRICALFVLCNGYTARRSDSPWTFRTKNSDNIYVKVQLTLDDELKESLSRKNMQLWKGKELSHRSFKNFGVKHGKSYSSFIVTRTTFSAVNQSALPWPTPGIDDPALKIMDNNAI